MAKAQYKASRPWWKRKRVFLPVLALVAIVGCSALISSAAKDADKDIKEKNASIQDDAEIAACRTDDAGYMVADVKVTNDSSERSNYGVDVSFVTEDGGTQIDSASAFISSLEPDQTTTQTAQTLTEPTGAFECKITDVTRFTDEP